MSTSGSGKAILAAFVANLGISVAKFVGFLVTGASSMLAESIHSLADTGNQALLLLGGRRAKRVADERHNFGYGRERYFYSFVVALVLFTLGAVFAVYEGVHKLQHPEDVKSPVVALIILGVAIVLEAFSLRTALHESAALRERHGMWHFVRTSKVPELPVVLLEDIGALAGLGIATVALTLAWKVDPVFDGVGSIVIGSLLGVIAVILAMEMKSLLIGESADPAVADHIREAIASSAEVEHLIHLRTEHIGPEQVLIATKVAYSPRLDVARLAEAIDATEAAIRASVPMQALIYIEPGLAEARQESSPGGGTSRH
ncbi:MAG: cation diffusion facilitator family transporter [Microthrixaceae bacterium]